MVPPPPNLLLPLVLSLPRCPVSTATAVIGSPRVDKVVETKFSSSALATVPLSTPLKRGLHLRLFRAPSSNNQKTVFFVEFLGQLACGQLSKNTMSSSPAPVFSNGSPSGKNAVSTTALQQAPQHDGKAEHMTGSVYLQTNRNVILVRRPKNKDDGPMRSLARWFVNNQIGKLALALLPWWSLH